VKTSSTAPRSHTGRPRTRARLASVAMVVLMLAAVGCSSATDPTSAGGPGTSAVATDAVGRPIIRPRCTEPDEGRYLHAAGHTRVTPVLLLGTGPRGVVVGAQANGGICQMLEFGRELVGKGYHVAVFDWTSPYDEAMMTATAALVAEGAEKVVLGGFSRGALVGLGVAPSLGSPIVGVFSVSGGPSAPEGFGTIESLSMFQGPILLIGSENDPLFPAATTQSIAAAHAGPETVLIVPGSSHALALLSGPDASRVQASLDEFLVQAWG
jgi:dienelactone hydrolase